MRVPRADQFDRIQRGGGAARGRRGRGKKPLKLPRSNSAFSTGRYESKVLGKSFQLNCFKEKALKPLTRNEHGMAVTSRPSEIQKLVKLFLVISGMHLPKVSTLAEYTSLKQSLFVIGSHSSSSEITIFGAMDVPQKSHSGRDFRNPLVINDRRLSGSSEKINKRDKFVEFVVNIRFSIEAKDGT
ncbi:hypothetical protein HWI79_325 [Cryptosporidium felis]|nr:hypothetical protein HWI79_325 [Cryptosporidium felis]